MACWDLAADEKAAPDAASLTAARRLAVPGPWSDTGSTETLVWGKSQGSGKSPYQVSIDLAGPAYRCSRPSQLTDPVDVLFGVQLGGGTDINRAIAYFTQDAWVPSGRHALSPNALTCRRTATGSSAGGRRASTHHRGGRTCC